MKIQGAEGDHLQQAAINPALHVHAQEHGMHDGLLAHSVPPIHSPLQA